MRRTKLLQKLHQKAKVYKRNANSKKRNLYLSKNQMIKLFKSPCFYCGKPAYVSPNGIDRLDNSIHYIEGNVVASCSKCNFMKGKMSKPEFIEQVERIYKHSVLQTSNNILFWGKL